MKKMISLLLVLAMLMTILSGCGKQTVPEEPTVETQSEHEMVVETEKEPKQAKPEEQLEELPEYEPEKIEETPVFGTLEDEIYAELSNSLDPEQYSVEDISTAYISKEYLEEIQYNSQKNIFFGYSLSELDAQFEGTRYIFTLDENGNTTVEELVEVSGIGSEEITEIAQKGLMLVRAVIKNNAPVTSFEKLLNVICLVSSDGSESSTDHQTLKIIGGTIGAMICALQSGGGISSLQGAINGFDNGYQIAAIIGTSSDILWKTKN